MADFYRPNRPISSSPYVWASQVARVLGRGYAGVLRDVHSGAIPSRRIGMRAMIPIDWLLEQTGKAARDVP